MQWRVEAYTRGQMASPTGMRTTQDIGLCAFAQSRFGELLDGIFNAMLVNGKVNCSKGAPSYLLLYYVLVDPVYCTALVLTIGIFRSCMQCFLDLSGT